MICSFQPSYPWHVAKRVSKWKLTDIQELKTYGKELISHGPLTDERLEDALRQTEIFRKFSLVQIRTRINYERLLKNSVLKNLKFHDCAYMFCSDSAVFFNCKFYHFVQVFRSKNPVRQRLLKAQFTRLQYFNR